MEGLNLSRLVLSGLIKHVRDIRKCPYKLVDEYWARYNSYLEALFFAGLVSESQWDKLCLIGRKAWSFREQFENKRLGLCFKPSVITPTETVQDESEQVSASAAPGQLRVLRLLDAPGLQRVAGQPLKSSAYVNIESFDGLRPDRIEFPRLGKHWSPASVLVGYQERKGHAVCRA